MPELKQTNKNNKKEKNTNEVDQVASNSVTDDLIKDEAEIVDKKRDTEPTISRKFKIFLVIIYILGFFAALGIIYWISILQGNPIFFNIA